MKKTRTVEYTGHGFTDLRRLVERLSDTNLGNPDIEYRLAIIARRSTAKTHLRLSPEPEEATEGAEAETLKAHSSLGGGVPVDRTAALVISRGQSYEFKTGKGFRSPAPLPMKSIPANPQFVDYTGKRFGRLTVVGLADVPASKSKGAAWVVRCDCGWYEHRRRTYFRNNAAEGMMCSQCDALEQRKQGLGSWSPRKGEKL